MGVANRACLPGLGTRPLRVGAPFFPLFVALIPVPNILAESSAWRPPEALAALYRIRECPSRIDRISRPRVSGGASVKRLPPPRGAPPRPRVATESGGLALVLRTRPALIRPLGSGSSGGGVAVPRTPLHGGGGTIRPRRRVGGTTRRPVGFAECRARPSPSFPPVPRARSAPPTFGAGGEDVAPIPGTRPRAGGDGGVIRGHPPPRRGPDDEMAACREP